MNDLCSAFKGTVYNDKNFHDAPSISLANFHFLLKETKEESGRQIVGHVDMHFN